MSYDNEEQSPFARVLRASPLGVAALVAGFALGFAFLVRFGQILDGVSDPDMRGAIQALEITVVSLWFAVALWGWYLVKDGLERANTTRRLKEQAELLSKIHEAVEEREAEKVKKEEMNRKARNFFNFRRSGDS